uniref:Uncharacterized protein n=1 Tax=Anopheles darlingi TaxID=43151 RepID=A0A2M4DFH8_ANODA
MKRFFFAVVFLFFYWLALFCFGNRLRHLHRGGHFTSMSFAMMVAITIPPGFSLSSLSSIHSEARSTSHLETSNLQTIRH